MSVGVYVNLVYGLEVTLDDVPEPLVEKWGDDATEFAPKPLDSDSGGGMDGPHRHVWYVRESKKRIVCDWDMPGGPVIPLSGDMFDKTTAAIYDSIIEDAFASLGTTVPGVPGWIVTVSIG